MSDPVFFTPAEAMHVASVAAFLGAVAGEAEASRPVLGVAALVDAGPTDLSFCDSPKYQDQLASTRAGVCLVPERLRAAVPAGTVALVVAHPQHEWLDGEKERLHCGR